MERIPAVAGQFYPDQPARLRAMVDDFLTASEPPRPALGLIAPHAGYPFSGAIAGTTFARVEVPQRVVVLGPNHHGIGHPAAVYAQGSWKTPLGSVPVDAELATRLLSACPDLAADEAAHRLEHSLEVEVPFIQRKAPGAQIVPICLGANSLETLLRLGKDLGDAVKAFPEPVLLVVSSDMTHYESAEAARRKDMRALDRIMELDAANLYHTVRGEGITMCGVIPSVVMLAAVERLGARKATLVRYGNSGDVTGDRAQVVGYAGVIIE